MFLRVWVQADPRGSARSALWSASARGSRADGSIAEEKGPAKVLLEPFSSGISRWPPARAAQRLCAQPGAERRRGCLGRRWRGSLAGRQPPPGAPAWRGGAPSVLGGRSRKRRSRRGRDSQPAALCSRRRTPRLTVPSSRHRLLVQQWSGSGTRLRQGPRLQGLSATALAARDAAGGSCPAATTSLARSAAAARSPEAKPLGVQLPGLC
mmetsp:Transcript_127492/g.408068  ORF Transcript_127492/g.408068 Transcript_127492/m.408068 type:complete len:209 (-) Transcript_127492:212-838(-)